MIDFNNASFVKMKPNSNDTYKSLVMPLLVDGENLISTYQGMRDGVVFTNKRIIAVNVQGVTGKKKDITSLPYAKIQAFSTETSGVLDLDSELEIWFSGLGKVKFEFSGKTDIVEICNMISNFVL